MLDQLATYLLTQGLPGVALLVVVVAVGWLALWLRSLIEAAEKRCQADAAAQRQLAAAETKASAAKRDAMQKEIDKLRLELWSETRERADAAQKTLEKNTEALRLSAEALVEIRKLFQSVKK